MHVLWSVTQLWPSVFTSLTGVGLSSLVRLVVLWLCVLSRFVVCCCYLWFLKSLFLKRKAEKTSISVQEAEPHGEEVLPSARNSKKWCCSCVRQTPEQLSLAPQPPFLSASGDDKGLPRAHHRDGVAHVNSSLCLLRLPLLLWWIVRGNGRVMVLASSSPIQRRRAAPLTERQLRRLYNTLLCTSILILTLHKHSPLHTRWGSLMSPAWWLPLLHCLLLNSTFFHQLGNSSLPGKMLTSSGPWSGPPCLFLVCEAVFVHVSTLQLLSEYWCQNVFRLTVIDCVTDVTLLLYKEEGLLTCSRPDDANIINPSVSFLSNFTN